jgi:hypothetical protein
LGRINNWLAHVNNVVGPDDHAVITRLMECDVRTKLRLIASKRRLIPATLGLTAVHPRMVPSTHGLIAFTQGLVA